MEDFDLNNVDGTLVVQTLYFTGIGAVSLAGLLPLPEGLVNGTAVNDVITTGASDDVVQAFGGNDSLDTSAGADVLIGGGGTIAATEGKEVELPQGTVLRVRIEPPVPL